MNFRRPTLMGCKCGTIMAIDGTVLIEHKILSADVKAKAMTTQSIQPQSVPGADSPASDTPGHPADTSLYDAGRDVHYTKPVLRGWMHLVWFEASLVLGTLLIARAQGATRITAVAIYTASVSGLFGISALYHRGNWSQCWSRRLQRLDHLMIFFLIAGTATPAFMIATPHPWGLVGVIVLWTLTLTATVIHFAWMNAPELLVGATFVGLGWASGLALPGVWSNAGVAPAVLMVVGGLLYTIGAVSYHRRRPDPSPAIFGYHEVFHAYVCAAAACHYVAIALFIV
jgi:hemolysin III